MSWGALGNPKEVQKTTITKKEVQKTEISKLDANEKFELASAQKNTTVSWSKLKTVQALLSKQLVELCMFEDADIAEAQSLRKSESDIKDIKFRYTVKRKEIQDKIWHNKKMRKELNIQLKYMQEFSKVPNKVIMPEKIKVETDPKRMVKKLNTLRAQLYTNRRYVKEGYRTNPRTKDKIKLDSSQIENYKNQIKLYEAAVLAQEKLISEAGI